MAAMWDKDAKTFLITDAGSVKDRALSLGIYKRTPDFNKDTKSYKEQRRLPFGLSTKEDIYAFAGRSENGDLYVRGTKHESNWVRTKDTEYYPGKGKRSEDRRYFGGLFSAGKDYDKDGEIIGTREGDIFGSISWSKSKDGRHQSLETDDFGGWHRSRREAIGLPDGSIGKWRTMERHVGSYSMTIAPSQDGTHETKTRSLGRLAGRNIVERSVTYDFETGEKTTRYGGLLRRILPKPKPSPISTRDMDAYKIRREAAQAAGNAWSDHALGLQGDEGMGLSSSVQAALFKEGLQHQGRATNRVSDWVGEREAEHDAAGMQPIPFRPGAGARHHDTPHKVAVGEAWDEGEESHDTLVDPNRSKRSTTLSSPSISSDKAIVGSGSDAEMGPSVPPKPFTRPTSAGLPGLPLPSDTRLKFIKLQEKLARKANRTSNETDADDESDAGTKTKKTRKKLRKPAFVEQADASDSSQDEGPLQVRRPARAVKREGTGVDRTKNVTDRDLAGVVNPRAMPKDFKIGRLPGHTGKTPAGLGDDSSDDQSSASSIRPRVSRGPPREALGHLDSDMRSRRSPIAGKVPVVDDSIDYQSSVSSRAPGRGGLPTTSQARLYDRSADNDLAGVVNQRPVDKDFKIGRLVQSTGKVPAGLGDDSDSGSSVARPKLDARPEHNRSLSAYFGE